MLLPFAKAVEITLTTESISSLPRFDAPPVIETAISVQFARLAGFSTAMVGWFWKTYLSKIPGGESWTKATETVRIEDQFEGFGSTELWHQLAFRMSPVEPQRTQISKVGDERLIQIQDSRFILNWRKQSGEYPSFDALVKEFRLIFPTFARFAADAEMGALEPNQWELIYINHIPKGDLWQTPKDWKNVLPFLSFPPTGIADISAQTLSSDWRFGLSENRGSLYVGLRHAKVPPSTDDLMQLTLTARGPIDISKGWTLDDGLLIGHESIVRSFAAMTSGEAHKLWQRSK